MSVRRHDLPNGMRVITEAMDGFSTASVGIWIDAGTRTEAEAQNGIAHFLEHMAFKGTRTRSAFDIAIAIEEVGGYINAYTSRETTAYYARVLGADVPMALDVIAEILREPVFDPAEIEVERGVILQEIGQTLDTPDDVIFDWLQEASYPSQALGRSILGPAKRVRRFTREDLLAFVAAHYGPERMILAAAGAVDHDAIVAQAERLFSDMPRGPALIPSPAAFRGREFRKQKKLEQAHIALAFEAPGYGSSRIHAAQIYSVALGGGMSSRLFQEIRENRGLCYSIFAQCGAFAETGMLTIYAGTSGEDLGELTRLTVEELRKTTDQMTEAEVERARAQMRAGMLMGMESVSGRAERLARLTSIWNRVPPIEESIARIEAVTRADVLDVARGLCGARNAALAVYGPVSGAPALDQITERLAA